MLRHGRRIGIRKYFTETTIMSYPAVKITIKTYPKRIDVFAAHPEFYFKYSHVFSSLSCMNFE
ncbi:MAG TPA: hypothetical protein DHO02_01230 [Syntrophaceae bacterium]|nr:hypothetical protein [Syntrophaceae bacterium]